jgi:hypothetical protein
MDPFTLVFLAAFVYGTREAIRGARDRSAARAGRIEARRRPPGTRGTRNASGATALRSHPAPDRDHRHLHAPHRANRFGSRAAAALTTYPALAWMLPAAFYRGWRHGRLVGKHWRRNGGDLEDAKRRAAAQAAARGWHVPEWAVPGRAAPTGTRRPRRVTPPPGAPSQPTTGPAVPEPAPSPPADAIEPAAPTPPSGAPPAPATPTPNATPGDVTDAEVVDFSDLNTLRLILAATSAATASPRTAPATKGNPMSDIAPAPAALFENGDYEALDSLGTHGQQLGEQMEEHAAEIVQLLNAYEQAAENAVAEAASMNADAATQVDIAEFQACVSEAKAELVRMSALAEAITEAAATMKQNLASRHGAINEAVQDSTVHHAANSGFYGKPAA